MFFSTLLLGGILTGCAKGLYIKASPTDSVLELLSLHKKCDAGLTDAEKNLLAGKLYPSDGKSFTPEELAATVFATPAEKVVIQKLLDSHNSCRSNYVQWVRDYAPLSFELVSSWFANHADAHAFLIQGSVTYGQAINFAQENLSNLLAGLERLEFAAEQAKSEANNRLVEAYFGAVRNRSNDGTTSNSSLITRCGSRGVNFVTKTCN